ncbi:MAG: metal ABC transporter substrate-binding protein [Acidimicrobiales bacterium]
MAPSARSAAVLVATTALLAALATGCGKDADPMADGTVRVATSTAALASLAANVAGPHARVTSVVPEGHDAHTYEPSRAAKRTLASADLVLLNGLGLDEPVEDAARDAKRSGVDIVKLGDDAVDDKDLVYDRTYPEDGDRPNPHVWLDPEVAKAYVDKVADEMSSLDGDHEADYRKNAKALVAKIDALDKAARTSTKTIPKARRRVLAYHDAVPYLARRYGLRTLPAVQPSDLRTLTAKQATAARKAVTKAKVPAAFGAVEFPDERFEKAVTDQGLTYAALRDDDLPGAANEPGHSWLGLVQYDLVTLVQSLGGNPTPLQAVDTNDVGPTKATYPQ